jgi:hypothetical protein
MLTKIRGKRTYIVGALMLLTAAALWATGDMTSADALQLAYDGLGFAGLRAGISKATPIANAAASPDVQEAIRAALEAHLERIHTTPPKDINLRGDSRIITREIVGRMAP